MKKTKFLGLSLVSILALTACGGGGGTSSPETGTAKYIDSAVAGVNYKCGTQEGITSADGSFTFDIGEGCTFYLGDIKLRDMDKSLLKDGAEIIEEDVKVAQLLQSLDFDGNPENGITIKEEVVEAMASSLSENGGDGTLPDTVEELEEVVTALKDIEDFKGYVVTREDAKNHLDNTHAELVAKDRAFTFPSKFYSDIHLDNEYYNGQNYRQFEAEMFTFSADKQFTFSELIYKDSAFVLDENDNEDTNGFVFINGAWVEEPENRTTVVSDDNKVVTLDDIYKLTIESVKDLEGKSRKIIDSNIAAVMPKGAEEIKFGFEVLKEEYEIDEKVRTHGNIESEYYPSFSGVIANQCGTRYFTHAKEDSGIEGISFACNQENQTSGTLVGVKSNDNKLVTSNVGTWEIKNLPNSTVKALLVTINEKYNKHSDTPFFAMKDGVVWEGWYDTVGKKEPIVTYNQKAFDAFSKVVEDDNNDDSDEVNDNSRMIITPSIFNGKVFYLSHDENDGSEISYNKVVVTSTSEISVHEIRLKKSDKTQTMDVRNNISYSLTDGSLVLHLGEDGGDMTFSLTSKNTTQWNFSVKESDGTLFNDSWYFAKPSNFPSNL